MICPAMDRISTICVLALLFVNVTFMYFGAASAGAREINKALSLPMDTAFHVMHEVGRLENRLSALLPPFARMMHVYGRDDEVEKFRDVYALRNVARAKEDALLAVFSWRAWQPFVRRHGSERFPVVTSPAIELLATDSPVNPTEMFRTAWHEANEVLLASTVRPFLRSIKMDRNAALFAFMSELEKATVNRKDADVRLWRIMAPPSVAIDDPTFNAERDERTRNMRRADRVLLATLQRQHKYATDPWSELGTPMAQMEIGAHTALRVMDKYIEDKLKLGIITSVEDVLKPEFIVHLLDAADLTGEAWTSYMAADASMFDVRGTGGIRKRSKTHGLCPASIQFVRDTAPDSATREDDQILSSFLESSVGTQMRTLMASLRGYASLALSHSTLEVGVLTKDTRAADVARADFGNALNR